MFTVTCHTDGCQNRDLGLTMSLIAIDQNGMEYQADTVQCGVCGQPITDVQDA